MTALVRNGTLPWLIVHELRLAWRGTIRGASARTAIGGIILIAYALVGVAIAFAVRDVPLEPGTGAGAPIFAGTCLVLSLMISQAMIGSQRTLYETRDLDLLLTAPMPPRIVLMAKLAGIAGSVAISAATLVLPLLLPIALIGHPRLLGGVGLLAALALTGAALGLALTLVIARIAGPRATRTAGKIAAALLGGLFFLVSQVLAHSRSSVVGVSGWVGAHHLGDHGWSGLPLHAAFGDPAALAILGGGAMLLFVAVGFALQRRFLDSFLDAGMRLSRPPRHGRAMRPLFHAGLSRTIFAKEWRLLARDPALLFQIVLRLIYMAPLVLVGAHGRDSLPLAPMLAFATVLIASQLAGSLAWLTVSADDAPDLIAVAPIAKAESDRAKLAAALAMAAPFALLPALALAAATPAGATVTLILAAAAGVCAGLVEVALGKPGARGDFARRQRGSFGAAMLSILIALVFGGGAGVAVYLIGQV